MYNILCSNFSALFNHGVLSLHLNFIVDILILVEHAQCIYTILNLS